MGWKYTQDVTRQEAMSLIHSNLNSLSNDELGEVMSSMFGDNTNLPHYGANFSVRDFIEHETDEEDLTGSY